MTARSLFSAALAALALAAGGGCAEDVDPTLGADQVFTFYGYLDPSAERQAVRIVPIVPTIGADTLDAIDAVVTSVEAGSGLQVTWRDSLVTFTDGSLGHVFVADYTPTAGSRVTLTATASDGRAASAEVDVPPLAQAELGAPVFVAGLTAYVIRVRDVPRVIPGRLRAFVTGFPGAPTDTTALLIPVETLTIQNDGGVWTSTVPFVSAARQYLESSGLISAGLELVEVEYAPFVTNLEWDTGGLDDDALVEPGTFSNVTGGFGFLGGGYAAPVRWVPSVASQSRAGFAVSGEPAAFIRINEIGPGYAELYNPTLEAVRVSGYVLSPGLFGEGVQVFGDVPARGFLVVEGPFVVAESAVVAFYNSAGAEVTRTVVEDATGPAFGSYPDGRSYQLPQGGPNVFKGPLAGTPGQPNAPAYVPLALNEIYAEGSDGWVEILVVEDRSLNFSASVASDGDDVIHGISAVPVGAFFVADEGGALDLSQGGGEVYLLVDYDRPPSAPDADDGRTGYRVVDYRAYGPQGVGRSIGYVPDGPAGVWSSGLIPTRGAANANPRLASR